jgi:hypothetical protein
VVPSSPLPFETFLDLLRAKGYGVSLHEYAAVGKLLSRWETTNVPEFGDALAALISRSDEEAAGIRRLFAEVYQPLPPRAAVVAQASPVRFPLLRGYAWALAAAAAIVLAVVAGVAVLRRPPPAPEAMAEAVVPPVTTPNADTAVTVPPPPEPDVPAAPERVERQPAWALLGVGFLGALAVFWSMKVREARRAWLREAWAALRGAWRGPFHFDEIVRDRHVRLPKTDVEDAATLLGRVFSKRAQARTLDARATLRATLRRGLMPTLVTKPRRISETILVLQDVCQDMRLWDGKVEGLLLDLRRQGIVLKRLFFDGNLTRVSDRRHRPAASLESVLRAQPDAPLLIISSGTGLTALVASPDKLWMRSLAQRLRKTWLTPVSDLRLWPAEFNALPLDVWPMTRLGLMNAARQLAGADAAAGPAVRARMLESGIVSVQDIERLKRLASLARHPSPALLDLLRRRFAPDVPDAAILHLMKETGSAGAPTVRLSERDLARCLIAVHSENPDLEEAVRGTILRVLSDSEPLPGSLAHERWEMAVAVQTVALGELTGNPTAVTRGKATLARLAQGPLWEEARDAMTALPEAAAALPIRPGARERHEAAPPPVSQQLRSTIGIPWSWPGFRELVPAALAALAILGVALGANVLPVRAIEHLPNAYDLQYAPVPSVAAPQLSLRLADGGADVPRTVNLFRGDQIFRTGIIVRPDSPSVIPLTSADTGQYYQARATLPDGNLALSAYVWVTSDQLQFVLIDASPWANVTIEGAGATTAEQQTPFTAALMPGSYQVRFENPSLNPPSNMTQTIVVPVAGNRVRVTMPGFDPARAVDALLPSRAAGR